MNKPICDGLFYNPDTTHRIVSIANAGSPWVGGSSAGIAAQISPLWLQRQQSPNKVSSNGE